MAGGYLGKILEIDLNKRSIKEKKIENEVYRKYLSGSGLAAKLLYSNYDIKLSPLDEKSPIIFVAGLLTGTPIPTACKSSVVAKSPLTGIWAESTVGGFWGQKLKSSGYDGLIITGESSDPVSIIISNENVTIETANDIWGEDVYDTEEIYKKRIDEKSEVACIGVAGENIVDISGIMIGGRETRAAGRCGLGAIMGSKKLKAIVVSGNQKVPVHDQDSLMTNIKEFIPPMREKTEGLRKFGTAGGVASVEANGDLPIKNWTGGSWEEGAEKTSGQALSETLQTGHYACFACPIRCGKNVKQSVGPYKGEEGHGPEYETVAAFGANILNDDLEYLCAANDLCNRYGLDTISTGNVIAMAIESFEKGLIDEEDTGGIKLEWGNMESVLVIIEKIAKKEGIGEVLSKGVKKASEEIGGIAKEYAIETKGLSYAFHDPRAFTSMAANYATANRGACHLEALSYFTESGVYPASLFGFTKEFEPHGFKNKGELAVKMQNLMNIFNAAGLCKFLIRGEVTPEIIKDWINHTTGWDLKTEDIFNIGERLHNLKRYYNYQLGISRKDDVLPPRLLSHDRKTGRSAGSLPHIGFILNDYYKYRGWNEEGIPKKEKLQELELDFVLDDNG